jgi:hypothetical protein
MTKHRREEEISRIKPTVALKTLSTMPPDLLSYALLADPIASAFRATENSQLRELFKSRMIQPEDSAETKIQQLTVDFTTNDEERLRGSGFGKVDEDAIIEQIRECDVFSKLHRIVSMLSRTGEGCQFLARNISAIMKSVKKCGKQTSLSLRAEKVTPFMVLIMLNNLQLNMESKGVQTGPHICNAGLEYAAMNYNLPAVRKYLQISQENSYPTDSRTLSALKDVFRGMKSETKGIHTDGQNESAEVLRLITGWDDGRSPWDSGERNLSFAYLSYKDDSANFTTCLYPRYIMGLGELGLSDTLWAEWKSEDEIRFPALIRGNGHMRFRAQMFALAFMLAKDPKRAIEVLVSVPIEHDDRIPTNYASLIQRWEPSTGDYSIVPNTSSGEWLLSLIYEHYRFHNVWAADDLFQLLKNTVEGLSKDPVKTLNVLGRFLLVDLDDDYSTERILERGTRNLEEGLLIKPPALNKLPVYWKPDRLIF